MQAEGESLTCTFTTEAETFFVDASCHGLGGRRHHGQHLKLRGSFHLAPKGGSVCARRPLPHGSRSCAQHHSSILKWCRAAGRQ